MVFLSCPLSAGHGWSGQRSVSPSVDLQHMVTAVLLYLLIMTMGIKSVFNRGIIKSLADSKD